MNGMIVVFGLVMVAQGGRQLSGPATTAVLATVMVPGIAVLVLALRRRLLLNRTEAARSQR